MKDSVPVINLNTLQNDILPYLETCLHIYRIMEKNIAENRIRCIKVANELIYLLLPCTKVAPCIFPANLKTQLYSRILMSSH